MIHPKDRAADNPRVQCDACGRWCAAKGKEVPAGYFAFNGLNHAALPGKINSVHAQLLCKTHAAHMEWAFDIPWGSRSFKATKTLPSTPPGTLEPMAPPLPPTVKIQPKGSQPLSPSVLQDPLVACFYLLFSHAMEQSSEVVPWGYGLYYKSSGEGPWKQNMYSKGDIEDRIKKLKLPYSGMTDLYAQAAEMVKTLVKTDTYLFAYGGTKKKKGGGK